MIREDKFLISKRPYAVKLDSLHVRHSPSREYAPGQWSAEHWRCDIDAVWFRRRRGETVAVLGQLWDLQDVEPKDGEAFLLAHEDGRYGGSTEARWDGTGLWSNGLSLADEKLCLKILRPMLENYPAIPPGYSGWWRF